MSQAAIAPGPKGNILLHPGNNIRQRAHLYLQQLEKEYGDISRVKFGPFTVLFIANPDYIEHMLLNRDTYVKIKEGGMLRHLLGNGLLTSEGEFWMKQRRLIQPVFHKQRLDAFAKKISAATLDMIAGWKGRHNTPLDIYNEMNQVTLDIVGRTLFSTNVKGEFTRVSRALTLMLEAVNKRSMFMRFPLWFPLPSHMRIQRNLQVLDETIQDIINKRRGETGKFDDLLTMLMEVEDADTAERMTDKQLRDEVLTIFIAGHETTANAMSFAFYLLAKHPEVQKKVQQEIDNTLTGGDFTFEKLQKLDYTTMVIKEAMRLYPPAWMIVREAAHDDTIGGYEVKKGDKILTSPYVMHRSARHWQNPDAFIPERFAPDKLKAISRYAYFPFGGGARLCVGNNFAMMEMQIILAQVSAQYEFTVAAGFEIDVTPLITLRPKDGVPLILTKRTT